MGNRTSAPSSPPSAQPSAPPPPLPPVCDSACQRDKQLTGLKAALDLASQTRDTNPEKYEKARIAYYTELNGQSWLAEEKQRIAREDVEPILTDYRNQFNELNDRKKQQGMFVNLSSTLTQQAQDDQEYAMFLNSEVAKEQNKSNVKDRMTELKAARPMAWYQQDWFQYFMYAIIALLSLNALYLIVTRFMVYRQTTFGGKKAKT
jgi:hypothetical protein